MLKLRRGIVSQIDPLRVRIGAEERPAWADEGTVGEVLVGDEVIINTEALDLGLGSGGFDVVHANLTRGLAGSELRVGYVQTWGGALPEALSETLAGLPRPRPRAARVRASRRRPAIPPCPSADPEPPIPGPGPVTASQLGTGTAL